MDTNIPRGLLFVCYRSRSPLWIMSPSPPVLCVFHASPARRSTHFLLNICLSPFKMFSGFSITNVSRRLHKHHIIFLTDLSSSLQSLCAYHSYRNHTQRTNCDECMICNISFILYIFHSHSSHDHSLQQFLEDIRTKTFSNIPHLWDRERHFF